jgi:hypothetical protein
LHAPYAYGDTGAKIGRELTSAFDLVTGSLGRTWGLPKLPTFAIRVIPKIAKGRLCLCCLTFGALFSGGDGAVAALEVEALRGIESSSDVGAAAALDTEVASAEVLLRG